MSTLSRVPTLLWLRAVGVAGTLIAPALSRDGPDRPQPVPRREPIPPADPTSRWTRVDLSEGAAMKLVSSMAMGAVVVAISATTTAATAKPVHTAATFGVTPGAYAYNLTYVPSGAWASAHSVETGDGRTIVTLHVFGLLPERDYGAHAHVAACGPLPTDAGGHFQYVRGGAADPAFANPSNEIWLDVHTNAAGNGSSKAVLDWQFPADRRAHSIVIHDHQTSTDEGTAGTAGPRYGCLTVAF